MEKTETEIQREIIDYLHSRGIYCWRNNTGTIKVRSRYIKFGYKGSPDIIGLTQKGVFFGVEVKKSGGSMSEEQKQFREAILTSNGIYIKATCIEDLKEII